MTSHSWCPDELNIKIWEVLVHRLWHATTIEGLRGILRDCCIRVIKENVGGKYRVAPLMFEQGCVSLFDFGPTAGPAWLLKYQYRNWGSCLWGDEGDKAMIWLELDRERTVKNIIPADEAKNISEANSSKQFIPGVEAGHRGPVPLTSLRGALIFYSGSKFKYHQTVDCKTLKRAEELRGKFVTRDPVIEILRNGRNRNR